MKYMEIKKDKKIVINARNICLAAGIINALCFLYCIVEAIFYNDPNILAITSSALMSAYLLWFSLKKYEGQ